MQFSKSTDKAGKSSTEEERSCGRPNVLSQWTVRLKKVTQQHSPKTTAALKNMNEQLKKLDLIPGAIAEKVSVESNNSLIQQIMAENETLHATKLQDDNK